MMSVTGTRLSAVRPILALGAVVWLLIDLWRVWTPSLITIFGQAAATPPELIGGFALGCMALPLVLLLVLGSRLQRPAVVLFLIGVAAAARLLLGFGPGSQVQLYTAAVGVGAASLWLCVATSVLGEYVVPGLAVGVALSTTTHAALGTFGAVWRLDVWGWLELVLLLALLAGTATSTSRVQLTATSRRLAWLVFPSLLLAGIVLADVGRASATQARFGPLQMVVGCWLAVLVLVMPLRTRLAAPVLVLVTLGLFVWTIDRLIPSSTAPLYLIGMPALVLCLRQLDETKAVDPPTGLRPARAAAGGAVVWVVLLFIYYAGYDLGYTAVWLVPALALVIALVSMGGTDGARVPVLPGHRTVTTAVVGAVVVSGVLAWAGPMATLRGPGDSPHSQSASGPGLRVLAWNLRMGYGMDGRFDARGVADHVLGSGANVVLLSEIDRGWLLNGGQDQLHILSRLTGMKAVFGPAADSVWGDAILTSLPVSEVSRHQYAPYGSLTGAEALSATVRWEGRRVRVIATHFQPTGDEVNRTTGQARELAALATADAGHYDYVVAGGDLNTTPGSKAWRELTAAGLRDTLAAARPLNTNPADDPDLQLDHILASPALRPSSPSAPGSELSDHFPVQVDLASR